MAAPIAESPAQRARKQDNLDRAAAAVQTLAMNCRFAAVGMFEAQTDAARKEAIGKANTACYDALEVVNLLVDAGAVVLERQALAQKAEEAERGDFNLSQLAQMESPRMRQLLALLNEAQAVAEEIDADRGRVLPADLPLQPGESRGTDLAEDISMIASRVRVQVQGVIGRE